MNHTKCHDDVIFDDTITTIVILAMLGTAVGYLWAITIYIPGWYLIVIEYRIALFTPFGLLVAGATYIIFRK